MSCYPKDWHPCWSAETCDEGFGKAELVDLLRADAALHMPMDVDGACMSGPKGKERRKVKASQTFLTARARPRAKGKKGKESRVCHECNRPGHLRKDCTVYKKRMAEKGAHKEKTETTAAVQGATAAVQGAMIETWEYTEDDFVFKG